MDSSEATDAHVERPVEVSESTLEASTEIPSEVPVKVSNDPADDPIAASQEISDEFNIISGDNLPEEDPFEKLLSDPSRLDLPEDYPPDYDPYD